MRLFNFGSKKKPVYTCTCCGMEYLEFPLCFGADQPDSVFAIPDKERSYRIILDRSYCIIDNEYFFHRGRLTIPIIDHQENFCFDIWTSISPENFELRMEQWENPERVQNNPYFGWVQNQIPTYENTINIKSRAWEQEPGLIPEIEIGEENHQLNLDQHNGITLKRALSISQHMLSEAHKYS